MKRYVVSVTASAQASIKREFLFLHERAPAAAEEWFHDLFRAIDTLEQFPTRCPIAAETQYVGETCRNLFYRLHRIIFHIDEPSAIVWVLHVRHMAQRAVGEPGADIGEKVSDA